LRQKCDFYVQAKNGVSYAIELKLAPREGSGGEISPLNWAILCRATGLIDAIKSQKPEEEIDKLLDDLETFYQIRTRQRVAKQAEKERK